MSLEQLGILLVVGALAGWLAGMMLRIRRFPLWGNLLIGVAGSFLGRFVLGLIGFRATNQLAFFLTALAGALLLLWLFSRLSRGGAKKK